tara:strand:- start:108 stop:464 length:357 start_codon:yes stop_codon:yes gene_type:complete
MNNIVVEDKKTEQLVKQSAFHHFRRALPAPLSDVARCLWFGKPKFMEVSMQDYMTSTTSYEPLASGRAEEMSALLMQTVFSGILETEVAYELSLVVKVAKREDSPELNEFILSKAGLL